MRRKINHKMILFGRLLISRKQTCIPKSIHKHLNKVPSFFTDLIIDQRSRLSLFRIFSKKKVYPLKYLDLNHTVSFRINIYSSFLKKYIIETSGILSFNSFDSFFQSNHSVQANKNLVYFLFPTKHIKKIIFHILCRL